MTNVEFSLLCCVQANVRPSWVDLLNCYDPGRILQLDAVLKGLVSSGLLSAVEKTSRPPFCHVELTPSGVSALIAESERRAHESLLLEQDAKDKQAQKKEASENALREKQDRRAEKRTDRVFQVSLTFLSALLSLIVGLILEYHLAIIEWLVSVLCHN